MTFLETGVFCSVEEYNHNRRKRAKESSLDVDAMYNIMIFLDNDKRQAAKMAVQTQQIIRKAGLLAVRFSFLDENMRSKLDTEQTIEDGFINTFKGIHVVAVGTDERYDIAQAYFKDFFDDKISKVTAQSKELAVAGV